MGYLTLKHTMDRISVAIKRSPIAVYRTYKPGVLRSVFADTVKSRQELEQEDISLIGIFTADMDQAKVERRLRRHILKGANDN